MLLRHRPVFAPEVGSGGGGNPPAAQTTPSPSSSAASGSPSGASGATSSPSAAPSVAPPASPSPSPSVTPSHAPAVADGGGEDPFDFSSIFTTSEESSAEKPKEAATPVAPVAEAPKPPVGAEPPKPAEVASPPAQPSPAAKSPQDAPVAQSPSLDPADPASLARALGENEAAAITHVAETMFRLTAEEVEALETNTVEAIPKLLARGFVKAQQNMLAQLGRLVPQMIQRQSEAVRRNTENEGKFFAAWPDLKPDLHGDLVRKYAATFRAMHPQVSLDEMVSTLGPMVMMAAKVVPSSVAAQPPAAQPMSPSGGNGVRPPQPSPFVPAMGGPGASSTVDDMQDFEVMFSPRD